MKAPTEQTIKRLFAFSKNRCAFSGCTTAIVQSSGTVTGKICHIKAQRTNGARYDAAQTNEERHAFENLILLCGMHHDIVDHEIETYTVEALKNLKEAHEQDGNIDPTQVDTLVRKLIDSYLRIEASEEALVMINSPWAIQAREVHFHGEQARQSSPQVSLEFEFVIEAWKERRFGSDYPPQEPKIFEEDYLKIYAKNHKGGLVQILEGSVWIPAPLLIEALIKRRIRPARTPEAIANGELEVIEVRNKLAETPIQRFMKPPPPDWKPLSPGMRLCLKQLRIISCREILNKIPGSILWQLSVNGGDVMEGENKFTDIPLIAQRRELR